MFLVIVNVKKVIIEGIGYYFELEEESIGRPNNREVEMCEW